MSGIKGNDNIDSIFSFVANYGLVLCVEDQLKSEDLRTDLFSHLHICKYRNDKRHKNVIIICISAEALKNIS